MGAGTISLIIPVFNAARYLADAIESVRAQSRRVDEIIVVDDASTDNSAEIAERLGNDIIVVRSKQNGGPAAARNIGIERASGSILAFLDADDLWTNDAVERRLSVLETTGADIACGKIKAIGNSLPARPKDFSGDIVGDAMHFGTALITRSIFEKIGMLNTELRIGEDCDWFLRAREARLRIDVINHVTMIYRRHDTNTTADYDVSMAVGLQLLKKSLDRRRAASGSAAPLAKWGELKKND